MAIRQSLSAFLRQQTELRDHPSQEDREFIRRVEAAEQAQRRHLGPLEAADLVYRNAHEELVEAAAIYRQLSILSTMCPESSDIPVHRNLAYDELHGAISWATEALRKFYEALRKDEKK